ncbi:hypothetical protein [Verrucomicrobium spinosum]|uniref:hypothetical protein n=1 Tax=Verrucomicrobium spinosum TaxID=2736 RepID=UPI000946795C|nr:hypothetical protein [Verrucomicrobium spinosum]
MALLTDTHVQAAGDVTLEATNATTLTATFDNSLESSGSGFTGQNSMAASAVLASNYMASGAEARVRGIAIVPVIDADGDVTVAASDSSDLVSTTTVSLVSETESTNIASADDAMAIGFTSVRNVLDGGTIAEVTDADLTGATVTVAAENAATLEAKLQAASKAEGGSEFGQGTQLAVGGVIASNTLLGAATATVADSSLTSTLGAIHVTAENAAKLDVENVNQVISGSVAVGVTLAFNSVGYESQNVLFQTLDASWAPTSETSMRLKPVRRSPTHPLPPQAT